MLYDFHTIHSKVEVNEFYAQKNVLIRQSYPRLIAQHRVKMFDPAPSRGHAAGVIARLKFGKSNEVIPPKFRGVQE